jgi:hypothetical protein
LRITTPRSLNLTECLFKVQTAGFKVPQNGGFRGLRGLVCTQQIPRERVRERAEFVSV